jgi:hypothetical protein
MDIPRGHDHDDDGMLPSGAFNGPLWVALPLIAVCGCGAHDEPKEERRGPCTDEDGDGFGVGSGCAGSDCNELVPEIHDEEECAGFCSEHDVAPGCPCNTGKPAACYLGPAETMGIGVCRAGISECISGVWAACEGEVVPQPETCDGDDDDCDGEVDDGVLTACGTCTECESGCYGPEPECTDWGELGPGLVETPEGWLTLGGTMQPLHVIWPSSSGGRDLVPGRVLRVSTETRQVEAAFWPAPNAIGVDYFPSHTSVDVDGDAIVANRGSTPPASMTRIASEESGCTDRNGDGRIETSTGWNDLLPFEADDRWDDECILWHTVLGQGAEATGVALVEERGLDASFETSGWVALKGRMQVVEFDADTGELTGLEVATADCAPEGAAADRAGVVWLACLDDVGRFDTDDPEGTFEMLHSEGLVSHWATVDENDVPWFSGSDLFTYDGASFLAAGITRDAGFGLAGLAADGQGSIWVGTDRGFVERVDDDEGMEFHDIPTPGSGSAAMACDFDDQCWSFGPSGDGTVFDVRSEEADAVLDDCGGPCLDDPHPYGDLTGLGRRYAVELDGEWSTVVEGCTASETEWRRILVDSTTPSRTEVRISVRAADSIEEITAVEWTLVATIPTDATDIDLGAPLAEAGFDGAHFLAVQAVLDSRDRVVAPTLRSIDLLWTCSIVAQ